ncbi:MAG: ECF transporter S component [Candidatus Bathyarchaeia archaeon]
MRRSLKLALIVSLTSLSVASRIALAAFPNVKLVAFIAIMSGVLLGGRIGFLVGFLSMLISDTVFFGLGYWTAATAPCMGFTGFLAGLILKDVNRKPRIDLFLAGFTLTLIYDILTSIILAIPFYGSLERAFIVAILGLFLPTPYPMGPIHEISTGLALSMLAHPIVSYLERIGVE